MILLIAAVHESPHGARLRHPAMSVLRSLLGRKRTYADIPLR
jgi:hypothetical protein